MEHAMREIVANGDTFEFAKMIQEEEYDLNTLDSVHFTLLHTAVHHQQIDMIKMLVHYGMNIDSKSGELTLSNTPLHDAVNASHLDMVDAILTLNADINSQNDLGLTPLAIATLKGHTQIALYLLKKEADASIADKEGKTPYIHAKENGHNDLLPHLPEQSWSLQDDPKWTALIEEKIKQNQDGGAKKAKKGKKGKKSKKSKKGK